MQNKLHNAAKKVHRKLAYPKNYFCELAAKKNGDVLAYYYDKKVNAGDLIGPYILEALYNRHVRNCYTRGPEHILSVGSVLHEATSTSLVWGAGLLNEQYLSRKLDARNVYALRGEYTKTALEYHFNKSLGNIPLGDPAILMPRFYQPSQKKYYKVGVVPHYSHYRKIKQWLGGCNNCVVLNIQSEPELFIENLSKCEYILSSSLHGLILADSYGIPNKWMSFVESPLLGGEFKFHDYYSTTYDGDQKPVIVNSSKSVKKVVAYIEEIASVKRLAVSAEAIIGVLPRY